MARGEFESAGGETVNISGQSVTISGNFIEIQSGTKIAVITLSGDYVNITGNFATSTSVSGQIVHVITVSGDYVNITGNLTTTVNSGTGVLIQTQSGSLVSVTGIVQVISGFVTVASGLYVVISGQGVQISGQTVQLQSGTIVLSQSASGEIVRTSGQYVVISGQGVQISGQGVQISGQTIQLQSGTIIVSQSASGEIVRTSGQYVVISGQGVTPPLSVINKTQTTSGSATNLLPISFVSSTTVVMSSVLDISTGFGTTVMIHFGRVTSTALTASANFRVEASARGTLDGHWYPISQFASALGSTVGSGAVWVANSGTVLVSTVPTLGFSSQNIIFIKDATLANSEFHRIVTITSGVSLTLEDAMLFAHVSGTPIFNQAEMYITQIDGTSIGRVRVVADGSMTGQTFVAEAESVTGNSIT